MFVFFVGFGGLLGSCLLWRRGGHALLLRRNFGHVDPLIWAPDLVGSDQLLSDDPDIPLPLDVANLVNVLLLQQQMNNCFRGQLKKRKTLEI